jgi:hypothetical protein
MLNLGSLVGRLATFPRDADPMDHPAGLSTAGLTIMVVSISGVLTLLIWTYSKILRNNKLDDSTDDSTPT